MRFPETAVFQDDKVVKLTNMEGELLETTSLEMDISDYLVKIKRFSREEIANERKELFHSMNGDVFYPL